MDKFLTPCAFPDVGYTPSNYLRLMEICGWNKADVSRVMEVSYQTADAWAKPSAAGTRKGNMPPERWLDLLAAAEKRLEFISKNT